MEAKDKKNIAVLGSTGSIGTQTLDIIERYPSLFKASVLTANHNWQLLATQALKFKPDAVVIADDSHYTSLKQALSSTEIKIFSGSDAIAEIVKAKQIDLVITAMVGYSGLIPTINAIKAKKVIGLANKETLVVAGEIIMRMLKEYDTHILPVDSEHSAIFQCLQGENRRDLKKILLTASGGPFRNYSKEQLKNVTVEQALSHPNWNMGSKVTIDSASMMNKGFEMIEAKWLFDCPPSQIEILVHPQSIVHSMVEFCDGSVKAQLGVPDMRLPIQYALSYPDRLPCSQYELDWTKTSNLTFELPDFDKFPLLKLAFYAVEKGGNMPCILNAANEVAVKAFLDRKIHFTDMYELVEYVMEKVNFLPASDINILVETNKIAHNKAEEWVAIHC